MKDRYQKTMTACFVAYIVQAIVNNFVPLLFLTFQRSYQLPLDRITLLVTLNFGIQLLVDLLSVSFVDRIGYRASMVLAHAFAAAGLILLTILPEVMPDPFAGILCAVIIYAVGGGLLEVIVSPVVEACPSDNKEKAMSMLHSFYCWGHVGVVLLSTLFFSLVGIAHWKLLALLWALVPLGNLLAFLRVPIAPLIAEGETGMRISELFGSGLFWVFVVMMICSGASEHHLRRKRSRCDQDDRGPGGPDGVCRPDGKLKGVLRQVRRSYQPGSFYDRQLPALHRGISVHRALPAPGGQSGRLCALWPVGGHHVAGKLQQGVGGAAPRRDGDVRLPGARGRCGLLRRPDAGRPHLERDERQP